MKKKVVIGISILIGITLLLIIILFKKKEDNYKFYNNSGSHLAFYYQDDTGKYVQSTESKWIEGNYILNVSESVCNGKKNPSYLSWNEDDRTVVLSNGISTSCTLYFDKLIPSIFSKCPGASNVTECFKNLNPSLTGDETTTTSLCPSGIGGIIKHDGTNANDAGDNALRFSGCNPNNYICLGIGSEGYNRGEEDSCPTQNKYRIIAYEPVTVGDTTQNLVKVIKAEYLTEIEFGDKDGTATSSSTYNNLRRAEGSSTGIPAYKWNSSSSNNWENSTLNVALNSEKYLNDTFGDTWINIIESVNWDIAGNSSYSIPVKTMYQAEITKKQTDPSQIGLMNAYDYGYASSSNNWKFNLYDYHNSGSGNNNRENNWLYNGTYEWTISPHTSGSTKAFYIVDTGRLSSLAATSTYAAVRPAFYLKQDTIIYGNSTINGSVDKPFKLDVPGEVDKPVDPDDPTISGKFKNVFDMCPGVTNLTECLIDIDISEIEDINTSSLCPDGLGFIVKHDGTNEYDADDSGIRYSGCNPNNYICFGEGSDAYNKGEVEVCPIKNKYRILGYVPVTLADSNTKTSLIKVIKSEYLTEDEFGTSDGVAYVLNSSIKRIESSKDNIPGYIWCEKNITYVTTYDKSLLSPLLNSDSYLSESIGNTWQNKIEEVVWNVGSRTNNNFTPKQIYDVEMITQGPSVLFKGQIGLTYVHDYGFAARSSRWSEQLSNYKKDTTRNNNWMYNGVHEWTISTENSISDDGTTGAITIGYGDDTFALRPVFYLKSTTQITGDSTHNGSPLHPFKVTP